MKTFDDLKFKTHPIGEGIQAEIEFDNGYGASIIQGPMFYTDGPNEYELAVTKGGSLTYNTPITYDVLRHLSKDQVTEALKKIQELK